MRTYLTEFDASNYDVPLWLVSLAEADMSWHNDCYPSFRVKINDRHVRVWVADTDPDRRESDCDARFMVEPGTWSEENDFEGTPGCEFETNDESELYVYLRTGEWIESFRRWRQTRRRVIGRNLIANALGCHIDDVQHDIALIYDDNSHIDVEVSDNDARMRFHVAVGSRSTTERNWRMAEAWLFVEHVVPNSGDDPKQKTICDMMREIGVWEYVSVPAARQRRDCGDDTYTEWLTWDADSACGRYVRRLCERIKAMLDDDLCLDVTDELWSVAWQQMLVCCHG